VSVAESVKPIILHKNRWIVKKDTKGLSENEGGRSSMGDRKNTTSRHGFGADRKMVVDLLASRGMST